MSQFPPQAYTRDVLSTAYEWLRSQPSHVRELAKDSDSLVALYFQSRRRAENAQPQQQPPSAEAFKQDLRNLAEGFRQFEEAKSEVQQLSHVPPTQAASSQITSTAKVPAPQHTQQAQHQQHPQQSHPAPSTAIHAATTQQSPELTIPQLDHLTRDKLRQVQFRLNLSSETEALRLLVTLGYEHIQSLLPK